MNPIGEVIIAGAGPGELDHLTIGCLKAIHSADVILYDALIRDSILAEFPLRATQIFVGKRCGNHAYTQTMIISAMIEHALSGRRVLRLKGGDPSIFAHLKSELDALQKLNIPVKILPGVSAMLTAAAELKVPLTTRGGARHIWITDGHATSIKDSISEMAVFNGTLVFYMGATRAHELTEMLIAHGMRANMPAVLIENAGSPNATHSRGTAVDFAVGALRRQTEGPGIFLVGEALAPSEIERANVAQRHGGPPVHR